MAMQVTKLEKAFINLNEDSFIITANATDLIPAKHPNDSELELWCNEITQSVDTLITQTEKMVRYAQKHPNERFLTNADFATAVGKYGVEPYGSEPIH